MTQNGRIFSFNDKQLLHFIYQITTIPPTIFEDIRLWYSYLGIYDVCIIS